MERSNDISSQASHVSDFSDDDFEETNLQSPTDLARTWTFLYQSHRGSSIMESLSKRHNERVELSYVNADSVLLKKASIDICHQLSQVRRIVYDSNAGQEINPMVAFAATIPESFFKIFIKYLKVGQE